MKNDNLVLNSGTCCFFCSNKVVSPQLPPSNLTNSLQHLSRYLEINFHEVLLENDEVPLFSLSDTNGTKTRVTLCGGCVKLNNKFSKLFIQLEKIEMELASCAALINGKFLEAEKTKGVCESIRPNKRTLSLLRRYAIQKYYHKASTLTPRIKLRKLCTKMKQIEKRKPKSNFVTSRPRGVTQFEGTIEGQHQIFSPALDMQDPSEPLIDVSAIKIKLETPGGYFLSSGDETGNRSLDDSTPHMEPMSDTKVKAGEHDKTSEKNRKSKSTHKPETKKHKCRSCSKECSHTSGLSRHYTSVHLKIRFKCAICGKTFSRQDDCKIHQKTIHGGIRYSCQACNKSFTRSRDLERHQHQVTDCGEELDLKLVPQTCHLCGKTFFRKDNFQNHLKTVHSR